MLYKDFEEIFQHTFGSCSILMNNIDVIVTVVDDCG